MKRKIIPCLLLATTMLAACFQGKGDKSTAEADSLSCETTEDIVFDSLAMLRQVSVIEGREVPCYTIDITLPVARGTSTAASEINKTLCSEIFLTSDALSPDSAMRHFADSLGAQFTQELEEFYEPDDEDAAFRFNYLWRMTGETTSTKLKTTGYIYHIETYMGGAHGSYETFYLNFRHDGTLLHRQEVFRDEAYPRLLDLMQAQLLADYGCQTISQLRDSTSITMLGDLYVEQNFLLEADSVSFIFNQYEIAPYSAGAIGIRLGYDQLADVLTDEFKKN